MKRILNGLSVVALSAALLIAGGCGNDAKQPTGVVVKGPVNGAVVTNANGDTTTSDANGRFVLSDGPYKSKGGKYRDLATNTDKDAPELLAPKFAKNITALTTLVAKNPALQAKIESLGINYDDALTTVTATNRDAMALNESIGAALAALTTAGATQTEIDAFLTKVVAEIQDAQTPTGEVLPSDIASLVNDALTATTFTTPTVLAAQASIATQITNTGNAVANLPVNTTLTGATGGSSAGTSGQ